MVRIKALCLAGVASLVATAAAHAADLLPPPPPVEAPFYPAPPAPVGGNWYLRGDVGVGIADLRQKDSDNDVYVPGIGYDAHSLDDSSFIDVGVGYRVNEYFRADITGEYRAASHFSSIESYDAGGGTRAYDTYSGSFRTVVGLINGYLDLGTWWCVTPFIGAGVGVANIGVNNIYDIAPNGGFGTAPNHNQTNFAYALMAGLDFSVTQNLKMEIGYRYLDMGNTSSGSITCIAGCSHEILHSHLASNDVRLGFRYTFADLAPPPPPPPLIRKY